MAKIQELRECKIHLLIKIVQMKQPCLLCLDGEFDKGTDMYHVCVCGKRSA